MTERHPRQKLYSISSIVISTAFGSPLAAAVLMRSNCVSWGEKEKGNKILYAGILVTLLLFGALMSIPDTALDKIPSTLISTVYTPIVYFIARARQGEILKRSKAESAPFHSGWRAAGVGALCGMLILGTLFAYDHFFIPKWDTDSYNSMLQEYSENEEQAMRLYELPDTVTPKELAAFIKNNAIPAWNKSLALTHKMDRIENIPAEFRRQNAKLRDYCLLRIKSFELIGKSVVEETDTYDAEIARLEEQINNIANGM